MAYRVEFTPRAWNQLGTVPAGIFRAIQGHLEGLANRLTSGAEAPAANGAILAWPVDDYVALYSVDAGSRSVVLTEVSKRIEAATRMTPLPRRREPFGG